MAIKMPEFSKAFAAESKGGGATRDRARTTFLALEKFSRTAKWGQTTPLNMTSKQVNQYIKGRVAAGISARVVQNESSHIRRALRGAGRDLGDIRDPKNNWSNSRCSVPEASRIGGKTAADLGKFDQAELPADVRAALNLALQFGLRRAESVKATTVEEWLIVLEKSSKAGLGADLHLSSDAGSKGGRPRYIHLHADKVGEAAKTVQAAVELKLANGGRLIEADSLKDALKRVSNACARADLTGDDSAHGLRRAWAASQLGGYLAQGLSEKTALSRLSVDLGHGDQRGRWVENNYLKGK